METAISAGRENDFSHFFQFSLERFPTRPATLASFGIYKDLSVVTIPSKDIYESKR